MQYKVVKYKPRKKKRLLFKTYEPSKKIEFSKEQAV